jgi:hypothetical protein
MENQKLPSLIKKLQEEIQNAKIINENDKKQLLQLEVELREILKQTMGNQEKIQSTTLISLETGINQFEARHPDLTRLISQLLDDLSNAGI